MFTPHNSRPVQHIKHLNKTLYDIPSYLFNETQINTNFTVFAIKKFYNHPRKSDLSEKS